MWCCINLMIILTACVPVAYSQAVVVSVTDDSKYVCTKPLILKCTVSGVTGCCNTSTRIWTIDNNQVMSNGAEITTSGKYSEKVFNAENEFTLTFDIERKDFEKNFVCSYSVHTSAPLKLNIDDFKCPPDCVECGRVCFLFEFLGSLAGLIMVPIFHLICFTCCQSFFYTRRYFCFKYKRPGDYNYKYCGTEYSKAQVYWKTLLKATIVTMIVILICFVVYGVTIAYVTGIHCYVCYYDNQLYMLFFGFGFFLFMCTFYWTLQFNTDDSFTLCHYLGFEVLTLFIVPIPFLLFWIHYKGENSQSVESGSSCWPICRVGQDPNTSSSDPEKVRRSSKKESADKKPTGFVRPQPSRAQHLGTDNTGRAAYSAENEMYSEKLLKSNKPRLLPSIGQQTDSPRPLPQMPASAQQGGNQLAPLEKKKKKRKKKREAKQSDEENSTEL